MYCLQYDADGYSTEQGRKITQEENSEYFQFEKKNTSAIIRASISERG